MKKLSLYIFLVLMWCNVGFATDIKDFEIEGMSVETSLLNFFKEEKIINSKRNYNYPKSGFYAVGFDKEDFFETYDTLEIHLKTYDKSYKIYSIDGIIFYKKNINDCYKKQNQIEIELSKIFKNAKKEFGNYKLKSDKSGKSTTRAYYWFLENKDVITLECYDWSKEMEVSLGWADNLRVSFVNKEIYDWFTN